MKKYIKRYKLRRKDTSKWFNIPRPETPFTSSMGFERVHNKHEAIKICTDDTDWEPYLVYIIMPHDRPLTLEELKVADE